MSQSQCYAFMAEPLEAEFTCSRVAHDDHDHEWVRRPPPKEYCAACGLEMHRYGRHPDNSPGDADGHEPTLVACANSIIALVRRGIPEGPLEDEISSAVTRLAIWQEEDGAA